MFEYFVSFIGQFNLSTVYLGQLVEDPRSTGRSTNYYYNLVDNVWRVDSSGGWSTIADPSTLTGATVITATSDVVGDFRDTNSGIRYIILDSDRGWVQFYSRSATALPPSAGVWPEGAEIIVTLSNNTIYNQGNSFIGTGSNRGEISTPGWIQLRNQLRILNSSGVDVFVGVPIFLYVFGYFSGGDHFFIYNDGSVVQSNQNLRFIEVSDLYDQGKIFRYPGPYLNNISGTLQTIPTHINPPAAATRVYPVGIDGSLLYHDSGPGDGTGSWTMRNIVYGEVDYQSPSTSPGPVDLATLCHPENPGFADLPEGFCDPGGPGNPLPPTVSCPIPDLCPVEINAATFIRQKRLTFYPLEIL